MEKDYFISALQMFETEGSANIPTVLYYDGSQRVLIGSAALAEGSAEDLNEDFKVDLGNIDPDSKKPRTPFFTASGVPKSAAELTADFLNTLIKDVRKWMDKAGITGAPSILLAEPLALEGESVSSEWLANYRNNLRRMLVGKGFKSLDFLPEPFAVFQYYRYGARHPLVLQHLKQNVLVVDFGGGTCDVCIVETTKTGDISQSGRNAKPLAAGSKPVGGFFINRIIAEDLLGTFMPSQQQFKLRKAIENYMKWRRGKDDLSTHAQEYRNFIKHFHALIHSVENPKLSLCRSVRDWKLEAALDLKVPTSIPADPFADEPGRKSVFLSASKLRDLFAEKVWRQQLKPLMQQTLERGRSELEGAPISVVLLSGGSANIGWLKELIQYEFGNQALHGADVLPLPDYQEVVAKGLAVECARRFYNETGDFSSVTYNRLCLLLDSDGDGCETRPFLVQTHGLPNVKSTPGLLLPSASVLEECLGKPIRWKVHFDHPPRKFLRYYFLRSSFDPEDAKNVYNVEEQVVFTPPNCPFDANLQVELMVNDDGTARPSFIYKAGTAQFPGAVGKGHPFYLDMTSARNVTHDPEAYIGLDFGTSNSSVSYVDQGSVKVYRLRAEERRWREFTELVDVLPYPLAEPLARYLGQTETLQLTNAALEFIESALALAAYTAYFEFCSQKGRATTKLLGGFSKRSAGPLWHLLRECLSQLRKSAQICRPYQELLLSDLGKEVDSGITQLSQLKHQKSSHDAVDHSRLVKIVANTSSQVFSTVQFGFFEGVKKAKFGSGFKGLFRLAHGRSPFIKALEYTGTESFSEAEAMLVVPESGVIVPLRPLVFWDICKKHSEAQPPGHCYFYDSLSRSGKECTYKAIGFPCSIEIATTDESGPLADQIFALRKSDAVVTLGAGRFRAEE
jgi:molecular chaperone DnaK (HSP70)